MKNISCECNMKLRCYLCKVIGFFCYKPEDGEYVSCPCCKENDYLSRIYVEETHDFLNEDEYVNDMRNFYNYCETCRILFEVGCTHIRVGCSCDVYNAHFIKKWTDKTTNVIYDGMPQFDNNDDWFHNVNNVEVLEMYCPHKDGKCAATSYPIDETCYLT